jgi:hypothetical protein
MRGLDPRISNLLKFTGALDDRASMQAGNIPIAQYTWLLQPTSLQRFVWALTWIDRPRQLYGLPSSYCCPTSSCSTRSAQWMMTAILYAKYLVAPAIRKGHLISNYLRYPRAPFDPHFTEPNPISRADRTIVTIAVTAERRAGTGFKKSASESISVCPHTASKR